MARQESDREDLLAEATAMIRRTEWQVAGETEPVVAGVHRHGAVSIYFGSDPVFHFDKDGRLRRAFVNGYLFRTQGTTLARLQRVRRQTKTVLQRHDLLPDECEYFLQTMRHRLDAFVFAVNNQNIQLLRSVPDGVDFCDELMQFLPRLFAAESPLAPAIAGKR